MEPPKQAITYLSIADMIAEIKYRQIVLKSGVIDIKRI
jgi:hypothetical protein